jgi:hypothetical protein
MVVAGGETRWHRAWPGAALAANGDLVVAYKEGSTHHLVDDEVAFVTRSSDGGRTWARRAVAGLPGYGYWTAHGLTRLSSGDLLLPSGAILCLYRDVTEGQFGVGVGISRDLGQTWQAVGHLYQGPNKDCAYPSPVLLADGTVFTPYYTSAEPRRTGVCEIHGVLLREV